MKKVILVSLVLTSILVSCKKEKEVEVVPVAPEKIAVEEPVSEECYSAIIKNDTISMSVTILEDKSVTGKLDYNFYEKDKNKGTLSGEQKGDTIIADYTFMSEGKSSVRQVAFLKKGDTYVEGHGYMIDDDKGRIVFRHLDQVEYDGKIVMKKVDCKM